MSEHELPDMVFNLELVRLNVNASKHCMCTDTRIEVDTVNHLVHCMTCGAVLDPFDALLRLAHSREALKRENERFLNQRKKIASYKPWLVVIKKLEEMYKRGKYMPSCPNCHQPFDLAELNHGTWSNRDYVDLQRDLKTVNGGDEHA